MYLILIWLELPAESLACYKLSAVNQYVSLQFA